MADTSVAIRLGTTGAAEVKRDLTGIGDTGEAEFKRLSRAADKAGKDAEIAGAAVEASLKRKAWAEEKIAALMPAAANSVAGRAESPGTGAQSKLSAAADRQNVVEAARLDALARAMQPLIVAQDRYNATIADLVKLHDSGRITLDQFLAEERKAAAILEKVSGSARDAATATKALDQARAGGTGAAKVGPETIVVGKSASASASAFGELLPEQERQAAAAEALRAKLDPLTAAQKRYDDEVRRAIALEEAQVITEGERAAAVALAGRELATAKRELAGHSGALGLNRMQFITGQSAVMRFTDMIIAGQSPLRAFALEAHKVGEVISMDDGGVAGGLAKVRALITPVTVGVAAATAAVVIGAAAWYSYSSAVDKLTALSIGSGRVLGLTGQQLQANAEAAASAATMSVSAAREIETGYVQMGGIGNDVLVGLTAVTKDFAAATGNDAKTATAELGAIFQDPIAGADELATKYGILTQAQVEHIGKLVEEGNQTKANKELLDALRGAFDGAADHAVGLELAVHRIGVAADNAYEGLGRMLSRLNANVGNGGQNTGSNWNIFSSLYGMDNGVPGTVPVAPRVVRPANGRASAEANAAANAARAKAQAVADQYTGASQLGGIQKSAGTLRQAIAAGGTPDQLHGWTTALAANEHALTTWVPAQQKAADVAAAQAKVAEAKTPAAKRAAAEQLELAKAQGEVATKADILARAHSRGDAAAAHAGHTSHKHAEALARDAESMEVAARASLTLADAYLTGGSAAIEAEARKKAATDATKKGIDVEAQVRRQLDLTIGDQVVTSAKAAAQLGDETRARGAANDNMAAGKLAAAGLSQSLSDEAALRPLLTLRALAHGDALETLNRIIERYTANLKAAHAEDGRSSTLSATAGIDDAIAEAKADRAFAGDDSGARERAAALRAAKRQTRDWQTAGTPDGDAHERRSVDKVDAELGTRHADAAASASKAQADQLAMTQAEIGLVGKSADEHDRVVARLQVQQQLVDELGGDYAKFAPAILAQADATEQAKQKLQGLTQDWGEARQAGEQLLDDVLSPSSWSDWGDMGKKVLADIEQEMLKLAILNPLKNALFGGSSSTIGGVVGSLFGSKAGFTLDPSIAGNGSSINTGVTLPHNAAGTADWSGGRTWLSENGGEIADLPSGTRIYPAAESRRMMEAANSNVGPARVELHLKSDMLAAQIADGADGQISIHAPGIAAGGAALGGQQAARARRRRLGTR